MLRRLYFLLPDESHAETIVNELFISGVPKRAIHAMGNQEHTLENLPKALPSQLSDRGAHLESILWFGNLWLFFTALMFFLFSLVNGSFLLGVTMLLVMGVTFIAGERFVAQLPNTHLDNFTSAIRHGEILLMVDVPFYQARKIGDQIRRHHPEAQLGGACWSIDALGI